MRGLKKGGTEGNKEKEEKKKTGQERKRRRRRGTRRVRASLSGEACTVQANAE